METITLKDLNKSQYNRLLVRSSGQDVNITESVQKLMDTVRVRGDRPLEEYFLRKYSIKKGTSLRVTKSEINEAYTNSSKEFITATNQMIANIKAVHQAQLPRKRDFVVEPMQGIKVWREWRAIERVGLYIPGGQATYPSSVCMSAIPAIVAGCSDIVVCTPARENGKIPAAVLVAADLLGIREIYKIGGPLSIAAMAYGTETIPKVSKIFGAGGAAVTVAKKIALSEVAIDMPAGPSEVFVIADEYANPSYVAADIICDCEHGDDSAGVIVSTSKTLLAAVIGEIKRQTDSLSTRGRVLASLRKYGVFALASSMDEAIAFANDYAPEHLTVDTKNPFNVVKRMTNAGSVFVGKWTSKSAGDYATGANHVLPTGGNAKMYPPLGVDSFGKWMQVQKCTKAGLRRIKRTIEVVTDTEGLPGHKNAVTIRFIENNNYAKKQYR